MRAAHPQAESDTIFRNGRLFGELYPLRAFGDVRYKWPKELQEKYLRAYGERPLVGNLTPPYLDADPEVWFLCLVSDKFSIESYEWVVSYSFPKFYNIFSLSRILYISTLVEFIYLFFCEKNAVANFLLPEVIQSRGDEK